LLHSVPPSSQFGFQYLADADRFLAEFRERLRKFGLELHPDKTRRIEFGRFAELNRKQRGEGKPEAFDFLGFTHISGKDRKGSYAVKRKTISKRMRAKLLEIKQQLRRRMHEPVAQTGQWLRSVVQGYFNYNAVPGNIDSLSAFRYRVVRLWRTMLIHRGQKHHLTWARCKRWLIAGFRSGAFSIHKGLWAPAVEARFPKLTPYARPEDVGKAAKDWPQLNFIIYHSAYRHIGGDPAVAWDEWEKTGRISWVSDLAAIPGKYGAKNVYADLGQVMAYSTVVNPRLAAALLGVLIKGLGVDHVIWGTDAVWTGSPQWQIEGLRRLEIPEEMQKKHGFKPLGAADGPVKKAIFGVNVAKLYNYPVDSFLRNKDHFANLRARYEEQGPARSNLRYGYVPKPA
jgi:Amidohydrolase